MLDLIALRSIALGIASVQSHIAFHSSMLCRCLKVTDAGYESVAKHCRLLQELRMYACSGITDRTLVALGCHLAALRVVDICGANSVTGKPSALNMF